MLRMLLVLIVVVLLAGCGGAVPATAQPTSAAAAQAGRSPSPATLSTLHGQPAQVVRVIDGDTVDIKLNSKPERLRLIGMDTPEVVDPRTVVQCFGKEASARAKELLPEGAEVRVDGDPTQDTRDQYGRLLAYLWLPDGRLFGEVMIAEGYAHEYTFRVPYQQQAAFKRAEREARAAGRGLWAADTCAGDTQQAVGRPSGTTPVPTATPLPAAAIATQRPAAAPTPMVPANVYYANCAAAKTARAAPLYRGQPGYRPELDGDRDGIACE